MPKYAELPAFREQNFITEADGDMLHREARTLAIRRIEESARTEADFENVLYWWDKLDANRERKERDHETGRSTVPLEWGTDELYLSNSPSKPDFRKNGVESGWSVTDREGIAITMAMGTAPQAVAMGLQKEYAERYDWLVKEFTDWAFTFMTSFLYYMDYDTIDEQTRSLYRQGISAFGGIAPTYRIALEKDSPVIVWDFHSLLVMVQMCFSFMLTDKDSDMRMCKHCKKAFVASRKGNEFCSQRCKNQFNVYKSREKKKGNKRDD